MHGILLNCTTFCIYPLFIEFTKIKDENNFNNKKIVLLKVDHEFKLLRKQFLKIETNEAKIMKKKRFNSKIICIKNKIRRLKVFVNILDEKNQMKWVTHKTFLVLKKD